MTAFASKVWAGRRHPRWWIVVLAAVTAVAFVAGVSARAEAAAVEWTPYSGSAQWTDDSCGYPTAVAATFSLDSREAGCARLLCRFCPGPRVKALVARGADAFGTESIN